MRLWSELFKEIYIFLCYNRENQQLEDLDEEFSDSMLDEIKDTKIIKKEYFFISLDDIYEDIINKNPENTFSKEEIEKNLLREKNIQSGLYFSHGKLTRIFKIK
ncbi:MAG: hypothetical protein ACRC0W_05135 [Cetobacterium sp.]